MLQMPSYGFVLQQPTTTSELEVDEESQMPQISSQRPLIAELEAMQKPRVADTDGIGIQSDQAGPDHFTNKALDKKKPPKFSLAKAIMEKYEVDKPIEAMTTEKEEMDSPFATTIEKQEEAGPPSPTANSPTAQQEQKSWWIGSLIKNTDATNVAAPTPTPPPAFKKPFIPKIPIPQTVVTSEEPEPFKNNEETIEKQKPEEAQKLPEPRRSMPLPYRFRMPQRRVIDPSPEKQGDADMAFSVKKDEEKKENRESPSKPANPLSARAWRKIPVSKHRDEGEDAIAEISKRKLEMADIMNGSQSARVMSRRSDAMITSNEKVKKQDDQFQSILDKHMS